MRDGFHLSIAGIYNKKETALPCVLGWRIRALEMITKNKKNLRIPANGIALSGQMLLRRKNLIIAKKLDTR